jgi:hypothetical protein
MRSKMKKIDGVAVVEECIAVWVIYDKPSDFPNSLVVRRWSLAVSGSLVAEDECVLASTLEEARTYIPPGLVRQDPTFQDDPVITEFWLPPTERRPVH